MVTDFIQIVKLRFIEQFVRGNVGRGLSCCGTRQPLRLSKQACVLPTAATRSGRFFRHRRRSHHSPAARIPAYFTAAASRRPTMTYGIRLDKLEFADFSIIKIHNWGR